MAAILDAILDIVVTVHQNAKRTLDFDNAY